MTPELVVWAVRSAVRLGRASANAYEQKVRDRNLLLPEARTIAISTTTWLREFFRTRQALVTGAGELAPYWDGFGPRPDVPESLERLLEAAVRIAAQEENGGAPVNAQEVAQTTAFVLVSQWAEEKKPVHPYARLVLEMADIGLEYVSMNTAVLGVGGNGEKLIRALAVNFSDILPGGDLDQLGPQHRLGNRLATAFFRGGLETLVAHPDYLVSERHLQQLIAKTIPPIVAAMPTTGGTLEYEVRWSEIADALVGPAAAAAVDVIAENQKAFFGSPFDPGEALGAVTRALLQSVQDQGNLRHVLTDEGLIRLYRAAVGVAATHPTLFLNGNRPVDKLSRDLLSGIGGVLLKLGDGIPGNTGLEVTIAALDAVGRNAGSLLRFDTDWDKTAVRLAELTGNSFKRELANGPASALGRTFDGNQLVEMGRIVLEEIASNPAMIGLGKATATDPRLNAVGNIISAIAHAMAKDQRLLLAPDDWLKIVAVATREAALNPERLFRLDIHDPGQQLAAELISHLLHAAGHGFQDGKPKPGALLFGTTLREMIVIALQFGANHAAVTAERSGTIRDLAVRIEALARRAGADIGAKNLVALFRDGLTRVLGASATIAGDEATLDEIVRLVRVGKTSDAIELLVRHE